MKSTHWKIFYLYRAYKIIYKETDDIRHYFPSQVSLDLLEPFRPLLPSRPLCMWLCAVLMRSPTWRPLCPT